MKQATAGESTRYSQDCIMSSENLRRHTAVNDRECGEGVSYNV